MANIATTIFIVLSVLLAITTGADAQDKNTTCTIGDDKADCKLPLISEDFLDSIEFEMLFDRFSMESKRLPASPSGSPNGTGECNNATGGGNSTGGNSTVGGNSTECNNATDGSGNSTGGGNSTVGSNSTFLGSKLSAHILEWVVYRGANASGGNATDGNETDGGGANVPSQTGLDNITDANATGNFSIDNLCNATLFENELNSVSLEVAGKAGEKMLTFSQKGSSCNLTVIISQIGFNISSANATDGNATDPNGNATDPNAPGGNATDANATDPNANATDANSTIVVSPEALRVAISCDPNVTYTEECNCLALHMRIESGPSDVNKDDCDQFEDEDEESEEGESGESGGSDEEDKPLSSKRRLINLFNKLSGRGHGHGHGYDYGYGSGNGNNNGSNNGSNNGNSTDNDDENGVGEEGSGEDSEDDLPDECAKDSNSTSLSRVLFMTDELVEEFMDLVNVTSVPCNATVAGNSCFDVYISFGCDSPSHIELDSRPSLPSNETEVENPETEV